MILGLVMAMGLVGDEGLDLFETRVRPILVKRCESCHGPKIQESGLRLDSRSGWERGGDQGPAIVPGKPDESLIIRAVRHEIDDLKMPPDRTLPADEIATLEDWVRRGAPDPRQDVAKRSAAMTLDEAKSWWAFQPVKRPDVPEANPSANPIDSFLLAGMKEPRTAPRADRRTLLRRASFDLTGLPPSPEEMDQFVNDPSPDSFAKAVDRLLASPHYGERWGRRWLDVVRYADTAGENSDHPLPHAWRYRNGVIDSFNQDQPYDEFIREQIAGDLLARGDSPEIASRKIVATGFLAIARRFGHDIDKDRHLTYEDVIDTTSRAVMGLSVACARCHDHKYDPISNEDYYALYGIFDSTRFAFPGCEPSPLPRDLVPLPPSVEQEERTRAFREEMEALDRQIAATAGAIAIEPASVLGEGTVVEGGSADLPLVRTVVKAGQLVTLSISPLSNHGADSTRVDWQITETATGRRWNLADDVRTDLTAANPHRDAQGQENVWMFLDLRGTPTLLDEPVKALQGKPGLDVWRRGDTPSAFVNSTDEAIDVWTRLPSRSFFVHPAPDGPVGVAWISPIDGEIRITGAMADAHPGGPDGVGWRLLQGERDVRDEVIAMARSREIRRDLQARKTALQASQPVAEVAYAVVDGTPHDARVQLRGDPEKPGEVVARRFLDVLGGQTIDRSSAESGRRELASWLTARENPLTARVMVNRIWQGHFGSPLVPTPNDFGTRGQPPTHPELLDWLAADFLDHGWTVKWMHRQILLSEAYQRSSLVSDGSPTAPYARFARRRLDAEEFRDSLLIAAGRLDRSPGQAHPFPPESSWSFTQHNPFAADYPTNRRSVYLMVQRNRRHPFLALFDGADPNATTPIRQGTTVPTQALYVLNDPFFHEQAAFMADRVMAADEARRIDQAYRIAYQRTPNDEERERASRFLTAYRAEVAGGDDREAWSAFCRVLLGSNEFLYLD